MAAPDHQVTRIEGFSDAVFGFALTLLVVSLEVPSDLASLQAQMQGFFGFALMFAMVCWIWYEHNWFFRRTGLQDPWTAFLNSVLLFVVLFYVYPMKFLTAALMYQFFRVGSPNGPRFTTPDSGAIVILMYSAGVVVIFGVFVLLYRHARGGDRRGAFTPDVELRLRFGQRSHVISMALGLVSIAITLLNFIEIPRVNFDWAVLGGVVYTLMGPLHAWNGYAGGKAYEALVQSQTAVDRTGN